MIRFFSSALLLLTLSVMVSCKHSPSVTPAPITKDIIKTNVLSKNDLHSAEKILVANTTKEYDYLLLKLKRLPNRKPVWKIAARDKFQGLLYLRNKADFTPLGGTFYDDGQGNLLRFESNPAYNLAVTYKADGENIITIDTNKNQIIDAAMGHFSQNDLWLIGDNIAELLPCLSAGDDPYESFVDCVSSRQPGGNAGGGGAAAGGNQPHDDLNIGLLGEPDCTSEQPGGGIVSGGEGTAPGEDPAPPAPPPSTRSPDDEDYPPMGRTETFTTEADGLQARVVTVRTADRMVERTTGTTPDGTILRTTIHRDAQGRETYREDVVVGSAPDHRLLMHRVTTTSYDEDGNPTTTTHVSRQARQHNALEPVNPDGSTVFEDPRCAGRDTRNSQGLGFLDICKQYGSMDFLSCFRKLESPLYNITGGRCRIVKGPSDANVLQCDEDQSILECMSEGGSPEECANSGSVVDDIIGPGGSNSGPVDGPGIPSNVGALDIRYIDTIPFGAFIAGLCASGGCPDPRPF